MDLLKIDQEEKDRILKKHKEELEKNKKEKEELKKGLQIPKK